MPLQQDKWPDALLLGTNEAERFRHVSSKSPAESTSFPRNCMGCQVRVETAARWPPKTSPKVAQLPVSSQLTVSNKLPTASSIHGYP